MFLENRSRMVGVDIGGSHITVSLIDLENQCVISESVIRSKVDTHGSANEILNTWVSTIKRVLGNYQIDHVKMGIAMPGPFDYEKGISLIKDQDKFNTLYGVNIKEELSDALGIEKDKILFRNDAEAFLHGEAHFGAAKGFQKALGITIGTGLGSAAHFNGATSDANLGVSLFKEGIAEDYLSSRWFTKRYKELTFRTIKDAKVIFDHIDSDPSCREILDEFTTNLAVFLNGFISMENPQVVVIGGNIAKGHQLFLDATNAKLVKLGCLVPLRVTSLWEDAAMIGAACYWNSSLAEK